MTKPYESSSQAYDDAASYTAPSAKNYALRWPWLLLSASCLTIGCLYLGFADWTGAQIADQSPVENTFTSEGETAAFAD